MRASNISFMPILSPSCPSLINTRRNEDYRMGEAFTHRCEAFIEKSKAVLAELRPAVVVLTSAYFWYSHALNPHDHQPILLRKDGRRATGEDIVIESLLETADYLNSIGIDVILVSPHPELHYFMKRRREYELLGGDKNLFDIDTRRTEALRGKIVDTLRNNNIAFQEINVGEILCRDIENNKCSVLDPGGNYLLYDGVHLSSFLTPRVIEPILAAIVARTQPASRGGGSSSAP